MERLDLRKLTPEDVPAMAALAHAANRNLHEDELARFLGMEGALALGVLREGRLEGMATALRLYEHGWMGPIATAGGPDAVGVAVALAQRALEALVRAGVESVDAEATPEEAGLLRALGFETLRRTVVLERPPGKADAPGATVPLRDHHFLDLGALDAAAVGYGRKGWLWDTASAFPEGARAVTGDGSLRGYALLRRARRGYALGPLVTVEGDLAAAEALLKDAVGAVSTWPVVALAPGESPFLGALEAAGFRAVGALERMRLGRRRPEEEAAAAAASEWLLGGRMTG